MAVWKLGFLFFWQAAFPALWFVPMGNVFKTAGLESIIPALQAASPAAAFVSPMLLGVLADRGVPARWLLTGCLVFASLGLALAFTMLATGGPVWAIIAGIYGYALGFQPTWSLMTSVIMSQLRNVPREFPAVRVWATLGWMGGALGVSYLLHADTSPVSGLVAAGVGLFVAGLAWVWLRGLPTPKSLAKFSHWSQWFGVDAWRLLRDPDHRTVFFGAALLGAPIMSFYAYLPIQLEQMRFESPSAIMGSAQVLEIIAMFSMPWLLRKARLRWLFLTALLAATVRFGLFAWGSHTGASWLIVAGIPLHGVLYVLYYITAQIYVEQRVDRSIMSQAQALLSLMGGGLGSLTGSLVCGWWHLRVRDASGQEDWTLHWTALAGVLVLVTLWFAVSYRGRRSLTDE